MLKKVIESRPQRLCKKCGKCCRIVPIETSYSELKNESENGNENAKQFLEMFIPYQSIDEVLKIDKSTVENYSDWETKTFYRCKYLRDDNLCSIYETRYVTCRDYPSSPWVEMPEDCGFTGWAFQASERIKHQLRKLKEELLNYETEQKVTLTSKEKTRIEKLIDITKKRISKYETIGAKG